MADDTDQTTQDTGTDTAEEPADTALTRAEDEDAGAEPHGDADGTELKTLYGCSTKNTVFSHMKNTSGERDAVRVVFDNSQNTGMSDDELVGYLRRAQAFKKGTVYAINSDGILVRIK